MMRLRACLGFVLLATSACAHIPEVIRLEVDGSTVEVKKKSAAAEGESSPTPEPENQTDDDGGA